MIRHVTRTAVPGVALGLVAEQKVKRDELRKKIADLSAKRAEHIRKELAKQGKPADGFDGRVVESLREQARNKGLTY